MRARLETLVAQDALAPRAWLGLLILERVLSGSPASPDEDGGRRPRRLLLSRPRLRSRLSVITGKAGTGKTTVARALLDGIQEAEGKTSILLLAPTGKARIRLQEATRRDAKTIHQFLAELGWIDFGTFALRRDGGRHQGADTVVIDEASMIPLDLLAALFRAIDFNEVRRLVLMGDPNQLPPIGPGRPFADLIAWLDADPGPPRGASSGSTCADGSRMRRALGFSCPTATRLGRPRSTTTSRWRALRATISRGRTSRFDSGTDFADLHRQAR